MSRGSTRAAGGLARALTAVALVAAAVVVPGAASPAVGDAAAGLLRVALAVAGFTLLAAWFAHSTERLLRGVGDR